MDLLFLKTYRINVLGKQNEIILEIMFLLAIVLSFITIDCVEKPEQNADPAYLNEIEMWHSKRIENLKRENGWLNLVGLYWLKQGENKFGSSQDNDVIFPKNAPAHIGIFTLKDSTITINVLPGVKVLSDSHEVSKMEMRNDLSGNPTTLNWGSLRWLIIQRGKKFGIRLRDLDAPLLKEFAGIERFPVNKDWHIEAKFIPYNSAKKILVPNILGNVDEEVVSGKLVFKFKDKKFSLDPIDSGEKLFIIFADETNGKLTYGAGRFLYADRQDSTGKVILDFNKAYNPPCAFTKYATCPLPPIQNRLGVKITAGEKSFSRGH
jgi:uncharacterized protein